MQPVSASPTLRILRKVASFVVYIAVFLPTADYRTTAWIRGIEVVSTALDKTIRRRKSRIENEQLARHLQLNSLDVDFAEETLKLRAATTR